MAINASDWCDRFEIEWAGSGQPKPPDGWRMKIMEGGVLVLESKESPGAFLVVAPHTWKCIHTPFDFTK
jgi:hypothetical protein